MKNHLDILYFFNNRCKKQINKLTFNVKNCILEANAKTFCFETNKMAEWNRSFFKRYLSLFFRTTPIHFCRSSFGFEAFSNGYDSNGKRRREECLKSKMAEKYNLNITTIVCQIEKWPKYIRCWCRSPINTLKFLHYNYLQLQLKLKQVKVRITLMLMIMIIIILKGEVI